jgi:2'-5' RNA ligase
VIAKQAKEKLFSYEELVVAVDLPTAVCRTLTQAAAALRKTTNPLHMQMFWISPAVAHLAILRTARVRDDVVGPVADALKAAAAQAGPFAVKVKGLSLYEEAVEGKPKKVQAVWAGIEGDDELLKLRGKLAEAVRELDVQLEPDPFLPHVPLALVDQFKSTREFNSAYVEWEKADFGEIKVSELLVKVANPKSGAASDRPFQIVATLPLGKPQGE